MLALESGVVQLGGAWFEVTLLALHDRRSGETLHTYSQTTPVEAWTVERAQAMTPPTYLHRNTGVSRRRECHLRDTLAR